MSGTAGLTPIQRRAERKSRNQSQLDMNLVSLIDIFTILIFFLLSSATEIETLPSPRAVKLPEAASDQQPRETVVIAVNGEEIVVDGRRVASVKDVLASSEDLIEPLMAELKVLGSRQVVRQENQAKGRAVTIMGDKDIPYRLLRKVMVTCARADFADVAFAVRRKLEA
jgi:biopolymer transport protein ExbD